MRRAGAVMLGKANLDEFPFGDFGISTVGGTIGNAFDPTLSTSGSSGGTAVAVSSSLATLGFGTDTCNSLSNPASFASLATIRTTGRGRLRLIRRSKRAPTQPRAGSASCQRPSGGSRRRSSRRSLAPNNLKWGGK